MLMQIIDMAQIVNFVSYQVMLTNVVNVTKSKNFDKMYVYSKLYVGPFKL